MRALVIAALIGSAASASALAADFTAKDLKISQAWSRPAMRGGSGVGYLSITNAGRLPDILLAVESPASNSASVHRTTMNGAVMSMRPLTGGLAVAPGQTVRLAPGGHHIMLSGLKRGLAAGDRVPATLVFQRAGRVKIELSVETGSTHQH